MTLMLLERGNADPALTYAPIATLLVSETVTKSLPACQEALTAIQSQFLIASFASLTE